MPGGNGTGPVGRGSMTGRAAGICAGFGMPGYANLPAGRGFGFSFGKGREFRGRNVGRRLRYRFHAAGLPNRMRNGVSSEKPYGYMDDDQKTGSDIEKQALKKRAELLESELDIIRKRLAWMDKDTEK